MLSSMIIALVFGSWVEKTVRLLIIPYYKTVRIPPLAEGRLEFDYGGPKEMVILHAMEKIILWKTILLESLV